MKLVYKGDRIPFFKVKVLEMVTEMAAHSMASLHPYSNEIINFMFDVFYPNSEDVRLKHSTPLLSTKSEEC